MEDLRHVPRKIWLTQNYLVSRVDKALKERGEMAI